MSGSTVFTEMKNISSSRRIERAYGEIIQLLDEVELVSLEFYECTNFEDPIDFMYPILDTYCCINPDTLRDKHEILKIESVRQDISFVIGDPLWQRFNQVIVGNEEDAEFYSFAWNKVYQYEAQTTILPITHFLVLLCNHFFGLEF